MALPPISCPTSLLSSTCASLRTSPGSCGSSPCRIHLSSRLTSRRSLCSRHLARVDHVTSSRIVTLISLLPLGSSCNPTLASCKGEIYILKLHFDCVAKTIFSILLCKINVCHQFQSVFVDKMLTMFIVILQCFTRLALLSNYGLICLVFLELVEF